MWMLKIMPLSYWMGIVLALSTCLIAIKENSKIVAWIAILLLVTLVHSLPKLMFSNPIWTDTYLFVQQVLHILRNGHISAGFPQPEAPGLS
ncbi:hypothetical protein KEJ27_09985, partial [Candidatus Bathyarchaeota archaeon]|nr:hypothetical protein [Candidatus Bathyarchaeota archaeon]